MLKIDWPSVLGPLIQESNCDGGISTNELAELTQAISEHSRRAIRTRAEQDFESLPFQTEPVPWFSKGRFLSDNSIRPGAFLAYAAGDYYIQDAGSLLALGLANVQAGEWVCDTCAAPGGKASGVLESLEGSGVLIANEVIRSRLELLSLSLARTGQPNYLVTNLELESLGELCEEAFDCVIVDAPCTGQSMLARGKQSLSAFSERQIEHSAARQERILRAASYLVKPGGRLIYSTCTFSYHENEKIIEWFLDHHPDWQPLVDQRFQTWASPIQAGCYRLWPHRQGVDGAFAAALRKLDSQGEQPVWSSRVSGSRKVVRSRFNPVKVDLPFLQSELSDDQFWQQGSELHWIDPAIPEYWIQAAWSGLEIAQQRGSDWTPSYGSAVTTLPSIAPKNSLSINDAQLANYMTGASVPVDSALVGWSCVNWNDRKISWGKCVNSVLKNHLPKLLRLNGSLA